MRINKTILTIIIVVFSLTGLQAQSNDLIRLMDKMDGEEGVTTVLVTKKMFELFTKTTDMKVEGQSLNTVVSGLDQLMIIEVGSWEPVAKDLRSSVNAIVKRDNFETLMKVDEQNEQVEIFILEEKDVISHLLMFIESSDESYQLISITGRINLEEISKLSGTLNIEGLELLEND